jgi:hypothetical protein
MRPMVNRVIRSLPRWAAIGLVGALVAACGASASTAPTSASTAPTAASTAAPTVSAAPQASSPAPTVATSEAPSPSASKGPATAQFGITGTAGLTGPVTPTDINCDQPGFDGPSISVLGKAGASGPQVVLFISAGHVEARVGTGSAATLKLRTFVGTGVTGFDAATGATLDTKLTETTDKGTATGDLGALSSISGTIDCGNQQPGTSAIVLSGESALGPIGATFTGAHVTCRVIGPATYVTLEELGTAGTTPVLVFVNASADRLQVALETKTVASIYSNKAPGLVTFTPGGVTVTGDLTETVKAGATPHVLHVAGDATCGTTIRS